MPTQLEKIDSRAELAYYRFIGVNNNVEMMDYGSAVYDDIPTLNRNKIAIAEKQDYEPDEEELKEEQFKEEFRRDKLFIKAAQEQQKCKDPFAKVDQLKDVME